jgi:transcriptional regulator with XRE-family HTH domain
MTPDNERGGIVVDVRVDEVGEVLGRVIRKLRLDRGVSQEGLARRLEMSRETVRRIEFGEGTTTATLSRVLEALDYTAADLLDARNSDTPEYLSVDLIVSPRPALSRFCWPPTLSPRRVMPLGYGA